MFELYRGEHPELAVAALPVVPDLEVVEHRIGERCEGGRCRQAYQPDSEIPTTRQANCTGVPSAMITSAAA